MAKGPPMAVPKDYIQLLKQQLLEANSDVSCGR